MAQSRYRQGAAILFVDQISDIPIVKTEHESVIASAPCIFTATTAATTTTTTIDIIRPFGCAMFRLTITVPIQYLLLLVGTSVELDKLLTAGAKPCIVYKR